MVVMYRLNKDIIKRTATQLSFSLNTIKESVFIIKNNKCFNGKSLIGILANNLKCNDIIKIETSMEEIINIRKIFNEVGEEVK